MGLFDVFFIKWKFSLLDQSFLEDQIVFEKQTLITRNDIYSTFCTIFKFYLKKIKL